jgi:hypothetical protein
MTGEHRTTTRALEPYAPAASRWEASCSCGWKETTNRSNTARHIASAHSIKFEPYDPDEPSFVAGGD